MCLKKTIMLLLFFVITGCTAGVPPKRLNIENSRTYSATYDEVWSAIIAGIAESNLNISIVEKNSGIIAISNVAYPPNWADEGIRGSVLGTEDKVMERVANFNIFASQINAGKTKAQVNSNFRMQIRRGNGSEALPYVYGWQQAYSNGALERLILDGVQRRIEQKNIQRQIQSRNTD